VSPQIEGKGEIGGEMINGGMMMSNQSFQTGIPQAQKKTSAIADSKKKWMRRI
jgi:hypothetical protein